MADNYYLGSRELVIVYHMGTYMVIDSDSDYDSVYIGTYERCCDYCKSQVLSYEDSLF